MARVLLLRLAMDSRLRRGGRAFATAGLAALGCATPQTPAADAPSEAPSPEAFLSEEGESYLRLVFLFNCAPEYVPYPSGEGPPVPARSEAEWAERTEELMACKREVAKKYTTPEAVRALTEEHGGYALGQGERRGIVQEGDAFLNAYVQGLLERERRRAGESSRPTLSSPPGRSERPPGPRPARAEAGGSPRLLPVSERRLTRGAPGVILAGSGEVAEWLKALPC